MDRARKMKLAFIAAVACLAAGCGGSGWLVLPSGGDTSSVTISATIIYRVVGYEKNLGISKDAFAVSGAGADAGGGWGEEIMEIYESTGGLCDFVISHFTSPNTYLEVFDLRTGLNCAENGGHPERCLDCTIVQAAGNCRLDCTGYSPMDAEAAGESIMVKVDNISTFKAKSGSAMGAVGIKTTVEDWVETDLTASKESIGYDLSYCSGGDDLIKADPADPESFEDLDSQEWRFLVAITDLGRDTDGDKLTICLIHNWVGTSISLAGVDTDSSLDIDRGPIRFISRAYSDPSDCPW